MTCPVPDPGSGHPEANARSALHSFLASKGADVATVLKDADAALAVAPDDTVLAVGSLVEGLGSSKSDLDLILLRTEGRPIPPGGGHVAWASSRCLVDMRAIPQAEMDGLQDRFETWAAKPWDLTHAARFSLDERTLLHRLASAVVLAAPTASPRRRTPDRHALCRLKLHVARQAARTIQVDMAGLRDADDPHSLAFAAQELMGHALDASLAAHGFSIPLLKWRSRLLQSLPPDWTPSLCVAPSGSPPAEHVWRLLRLPASGRRAAVLPYAHRISAFCRAAFVWADATLRGEAALTPSPSLSGAGPPVGGRALPPLDFDVDVAIQGEDVWLARLNEFAEPVHLSREEACAALFMDGDLSAETIDGLVFPDSTAGRASPAKDLSRRLARRGLVASG